jgi:hypothetical protein
MMMKTRRKTSPEGSASSVVPTITPPLPLLGEGARGRRFPLANLLPRMTTLTLVVRGEGKGLSVISFWPRAVREVYRGALAALPFIWTDMGGATLPIRHSAPHVGCFNLPPLNAALAAPEMSHMVLNGSLAFFPTSASYVWSSQGQIKLHSQWERCSKACPFTEQRLATFALRQPWYLRQRFSSSSVVPFLSFNPYSR